MSLEPESVEVLRQGKRHCYEVRIAGHFAAIISRAAYGKHTGAFWVVTPGFGRKDIPGSFPSKDAALEAFLKAVSQ